MPQAVEFESLGTADLIVDAIYEGTSQQASDPISRLLPGCGNMGGFRLAAKDRTSNLLRFLQLAKRRTGPTASI
jgi:hypothetical protein